METLVLSLLLAVLLISAVASGHRNEPAASVTARVRVEQNQTLWAIARQHPIAGLSTAQTADLIAELNGLDSGPLRAGAVITVPVAARENPAVAAK